VSGETHPQTKSLFAHSLAEIATITYRSGPEWDIRFGRQMRSIPESDIPPNGIRTPALCPDFLIETYLDHQVRRAVLAQM
jgi:homoserine acetyltransferase